MNLFAFAAAAVIVATASAQAKAEEPNCTKRPSITRHLAKSFSEEPVANGLARSGEVVELWSSKKGGSWTLIITRPDGTSCVITAGENWEQVRAVVMRGSGA